MLPINEADVVLGVHWLKSLDPVLTDYNTLTMKFVHSGKIIKLKGDTTKDLEAISPPQLRRLIQTNAASAFFHIHASPSLTISTTPSTLHPDISALIMTFAPLFQQPTYLPPPRPTNHSILLQPHASPVNVKLYCYPYFQKHEIETQMAHMLHSGIIKLSTSPFLSPVLLVKKRGGS